MAETLETIEHYNESVIHWRECAVRSLNMGRLEDAQKYFKDALRVVPDRCDIRYWMGKAHQKVLEKLKAKLVKKKDTPKRRERKNRQLIKAIEAFEYCAQPRCADSIQACLGELVQLMPVLMIGGTELNEIVPDSEQAAYSARYAGHLEAISAQYSAMLKSPPPNAPQEQTQQAMAATQMYQRTGAFHRIRAGAMFAMLGKLEEAATNFRVMAKGEHNGFLPRRGYLRCLIYHWLTATLHAIYEKDGDDDILTEASKAEGEISHFSEKVQMAVQDVMGDVDIMGTKPDLAKMMKASLADPSLLFKDTLT